MKEGCIVTDCWGELFYITPGLGLELGFDGPQGFPLPFHNELSVAMFLGTLASFDLSLLSQRFTSSAIGDDKDMQQAIMRGQLHVFPMDAPIALASAVQNGRRPNQTASGQSNLSALNTQTLSAYSLASNDLECVNRTQKVIRSDIRNVLRQIVEQERVESRKIEKAYKNKSTLGKTGAHIQHFRKGLHQATGSFLTWLQDVNDVVSINQRLFRILVASNVASYANSDERYEVYQKVLTALEKKEIVEALGFDPSLITAEKVTEVYSLAKLIHDDHATRLIIKHFIQNYIDAQHQLEWSEIAGGATFEIILTAFLAVVTGGVGAIASLGAQAKKLSQMKKLGELLIELAELLKKVPKAKMLTMRKQKEIADKKKRKKEQKPPPIKQEKIEGPENTNDDTVLEESLDQDRVTKNKKMDALVIEGHAPIRHGGPTRVTHSQLENRAVKGIDPASGTTFDAFNQFPNGSPKPHKVGRNATAFTSDGALLHADDFVRSSEQFHQNIAKARASGDLFVDGVELPLEEVFGSDYQSSVRGVTRLGSKKNPTGHVPTNFTDGTIKAIYRLDQNGNIKLHTLYPNPN